MPLNVTRIIAVRHGETAWNVASRIQGQLDIALNRTGQRQAEQLAQALADEPLDAIYSSDLQRAWQTAHAIARVSGCPLYAKSGLRERGFGCFEGKTYAEIETTWPTQCVRWRQHDPLWQPTGGESLSAMQARIEATASSLAAQHLGQQIVLVAHGGVMDLLYRLATGQSLQAARTWQIGNAAINRLLWSAQGFSLLGWADSAHLADLSRDETRD